MFARRARVRPGIAPGRWPSLGARPRDQKASPLHVQGHLRHHLARERPLGAADADAAALDLHLDGGGEGYGLPTDSRHGSPDVAEDFAADALLAGVLAGHDALRRREDGNAEAAQDARYLPLLHVDAQPRLAHAADAGEDGLLAARVAQVELEHRGGPPRPPPV